MKKNFLILENLPYLNRVFKNKLKRYNLIFKKFKTQLEFEKYLSKNIFYAVYCTFGFKFNSLILKKINNCKFILSPTTGLDHINLEICKKKNIRIISLKNELSFLKDITATAELTWCLILALAKNLIGYSKDTSKRNWDRNKFINHDLKDNSLGIVGYGRIGKIIERYAKVFGMKVYIYDKNIKKEKKFVSLDKVLKCMFITIHIPLDKNYKFFSKKEFKKIKKESFLINTSRGDILDERYFFNFLKSERFNGIGLDVLSSDTVWNNKIPKKFSFLKMIKKPIILTPHIGGNTLESRKKTTEYVLNNFLKLEKKF
jgi:D-3-phosphoglycerate dehydrogenase